MKFYTKPLSLRADAEWLESLLLRYGMEEGFTWLDSGAGTSSGRDLIFLEPLKLYESVEELTRALSRLSAELSEGLTIPAFAGYLSYETLHQFEQVPRALKTSYKIPDCAFYLYRTILEIPREKGQAVQLHRLEGCGEPLWHAEDLEILAPKRTANAVAIPLLQETECPFVLEELSNFTRPRYLSAVNEIKASITKGDLYQVNLSQQFRAPFSADPSNLYRALRREFNAPYGGYLRSREASILSASPELFISAKNGSAICTPIKGTRGRSGDAALDHQLLAELMESEKDHAELAMIVDLMRNDLGKVAKLGSVRVLAHARSESYRHLFHLMSDVECELLDGTTPVDLIKAIFPCGSITGCPKIAAMSAISRLEGRTRGVYTGSIGWLSAGGDLGFNVAIRTGVTTGKEFVFQTGGGVVIDSDAEAEYQETILKAQPLWRAYLRAGGGYGAGLFQRAGDQFGSTKGTPASPSR